MTKKPFHDSNYFMVHEAEIPSIPCIFCILQLSHEICRVPLHTIYPSTTWFMVHAVISCS